MKIQALRRNIQGKGGSPGAWARFFIKNVVEVLQVLQTATTLGSHVYGIRGIPGTQLGLLGLHIRST